MSHKLFFHRSRHTPLLLLVLAILGLVLTPPLGHATSQYIGMVAAQQGGSTCGTSCSGPGGTNGANDNGDGAFIQAPFAGQIISVSVFTGSQLPNNVVVLTGTTNAPPFSTGGAQGGGNTRYANAGYSATVADKEVLSGLTTSSFNTFVLASPVNVAVNQWVAVVFTANCAFPSTCNEIMWCGATATPTCHSTYDAGTYIEAGFQFGGGTGTAPSSGSFSTTLNGGDGEGNGWMAGISFQTTSPSGTQVTQCYGNCGSPPITLANTNSTHLYNFNQSITLLYEFQSNINGFLLNITTNNARSYTNGQSEFIAIYTIPNCPLGVTPFSNQCPGLRQNGGFTNGVIKGRYSVTFGNLIPVNNGQWVGVALSGQFSGFDVNDTNTNVNLFQTNEGVTPPSISKATPISGTTSKMGLWAWIQGNVITGGGPTPSAGTFNCPGFLDCLLPNWVNSFCFSGASTCLAMSGLIWAGILAMISTFFVVKYGSEILPNAKIPFGEIFLFFGLLWVMVMGGLSLTFVWVPLFFFFVVSIVFGKQTGHYL